MVVGILPSMVSTTALGVKWGFLLWWWSTMALARTAAFRPSSCFRPFHRLQSTKCATKKHPTTTTTSEKSTFSIVPASPNPSNQFTKELLQTVLPDQFHASDTRLLEANNGGRISFCAQQTSKSRYSDWAKALAEHGVQSLRLVVCECELVAEDPLWKEALEKALPSELPWDIYEAFGNTKRDITDFGRIPLEVSCRRWSSFQAIQDFSSTETKIALKNHLLEKYDHGVLADSEFTLLLYGETNTLRLEWTLLVPPKAQKFTNLDYLPKPGCKRVEAWMLMETVRETVFEALASGQQAVVLDPLCGKGTFLVEAATTWKMDDPMRASFVGIDASDAQLGDALCNVEAIAESLSKKDTIVHATVDKTKSISLYRGDSRDLKSLEEGSVTAIATCPPFGKQFFALGETTLATSYHDWLNEWKRVLDPQFGRIALLVDVDHQEKALEAIYATKALAVKVIREPFRLGRLKATVIVADALAGSKQGTIASRLHWEGTAKESRAEWSRLRTSSLRELVPYTKAQS